jgi:hypothetical protein
MINIGEEIQGLYEPSRNSLIFNCHYKIRVNGLGYDFQAQYHKENLSIFADCAKNKNQAVINLDSLRESLQGGEHSTLLPQKRENPQ